MTIQVYPYNKQEEEALLDFLKSRHYSYKSADELTDAEFLNQYNKDLDESEAEIEAGDSFTQDEVKQILADRRKRISGN
jgi:hypothetical protein